MENQSAIVTHYAILIGISAYESKPLKGCVGDVLDIEIHLKEKYSSWMQKPPEIHKLTASSITGNSDSSHPVTDSTSPRQSESPESWPTYANVTTALEGVSSRAKAGDFVYIHYSGHGTKIPPCNGFSNSPKGDYALVLLKDPTRTDLHYLEGEKLASYLKGMVKKGLTVTLVLDCCYSGMLMRNDFSTRFLSYDPKVHAACSSINAPRLYTETEHPTYRDISVIPKWLVNPEGYTVLAACGPTEEANEVNIENKQFRGALSYFLLKTLKELGSIRETQQLIYHNVRAKFRETQGAHKYKQIPILYGNNILSFFGAAGLATYFAPVSIIKKKSDTDRPQPETGGGSLQLEAGQAHGLGNGDRFTLFPWSSTERKSISNSGPIIAKITQARALVSDLELIDPSIDAQTGWIATLQTCRSIQASLVRLDPGLPRQNEWLKALNDRSLGIATNQYEEPVLFYIRLSSENQYEILDESGSKLNNLPTMKKDQTDIRLICDTVAHLAKFNMVRNLINRNPAETFLESFSIQINSLEPGSLIRVKHATKLWLQMENKSDRNLYFYIFNMRPSWQIKNILGANHKEIVAGKKSGGELEMIIPNELLEKGNCHCNDTIKVFITAQPTSFDILELPKLGESAKNSSYKTRGDNGYSLSEDWATFNFYLHITEA